MKKNKFINQIKHDVILGYHLNIMTCGVARVNDQISKIGKIPHKFIFSKSNKKYKYPLISIKISEFSNIDKIKIKKLTSKLKYAVFFHGFDNTNLEKLLAKRAIKVFSGNDEIKQQLNKFKINSELSWCPSANDNSVVFKDKKIKIFSFGMAHKVKINYYKKLKKVLENTTKDYCIYLSTALHENTTFEDNFYEVYIKLKKIFKNKIYHLGFLSDHAVFNYLINSDYFVAFFNKGVRSNNTSIYSAFDNEIPLITNSDKFSPKFLNHDETFIDINKINNLRFSKTELSRITKKVKSLSIKKYSYKELVNQLLN